MAFDQFDELFGSPEDQQQTDYFQTGGSGKYPNITWFNGYKIYVVDPNTNGPLKQKGVVVKAVGFHLESERCDDDLIAALRVLIDQKKALRCVIQHADGKRKTYYKLLGSRYYLLTHGTPAPSAIQRDPSKQLGLAAGTITVVTEKDRRQNTSAFAGVLAVSQDLYDAGYVDSDGLPKPLVLRFKGLVGKEFYTALRVHADYVKFLRDSKVDQRKAQFWAYACNLGVSEDVVQHGAGTNTSDVHIIVNQDDDKGAWDAGDGRFAGMDLYRALFALVFDTAKRPPTPGGIAVEWCRSEVERAAENQRQFNPKNDMPFGNSPLPDSFFLRKKVEEASMFSASAINGQGRNGHNGQGTEEDSEEERLGRIIKRHEELANESGDKEWIKHVRLAKLSLEEGDLKEAGTFISLAGARRKALQTQSAAVSDGFFVNSGSE